MHLSRVSALAVVVSLVTVSAATADSVVVFSELHYHPAVDEAEREWIELRNLMAVDVDISEWMLVGGVDYTFPPGALIPGGGYLVVTANPDGLAEVVDPGALFGPLTGRLDNGGERLDLIDNGGRIMDSVSYEDSGRWPVAPDGSGATLARVRSLTAASGADEWASSGGVGGTPGQPNFPDIDGEIPIFPASLVSYWNFDETSGEARDASGDNDGDLGAGNARVGGLVGSGAISFDNTSDAQINVGIGAGNNFSVSAGITVEAVVVLGWSGDLDDQDMVFRKEDGNDRIVLGFQRDGNSDGRSEPAVDPDVPVLAFGVNVGGVYRELDMPLDGALGRPSLADLRDGQPHHIAGTYNGGTGRKSIFIDGAEVFGIDLGPGGLVASGGPGSAYIGNMSGRRQGFTGTIDEVAFWDRGLGAAAIAAHAQNVALGRNYFFAEEVSTEMLALAFNELTPVAPGEGWIELHNHGSTPIGLEGMSIFSSRGAGEEFTFGQQSIASGAFLELDQAELGFPLDPGDKLFLYSGGGSVVFDAAVFWASPRARLPDGNGRWRSPEPSTPGAPNSFELRDEVVIHEVLYHQRPEPALAPVFDETSLVPIEATWRYDASGAAQDAGWRALGFADGSWSSGAALIYDESSDLPAPKNTEISTGPITFYFRTEFEFAGDSSGTTLRLRHVIDDGAVFYLNGVELLRYNIPAGAVDDQTLASPGVGNAAFVGPVDLPGDALVDGTNVLAVEVHQSSAGSSDVVLGVELVAGVIIDPGHPFRESPEAWIELLNRSDHAVDMSGWRFDRGVNYTFEPGTTLGAGEYLVVAADSELVRGLYPGVRVVGDFAGRLSHRRDALELEDEHGNPVDNVTYYDDGRWPTLADGGGSSLELRNPNADNTRGESWAASDESAIADWTDYEYTSVAFPNVGPTQWREFVVGLLDAGEVLIDDFHVVESPAGAAIELLQNGDFESGEAKWRILGNHRHSQVIQDPEDASNSVLHLVATGPTEHMHNHLETTLAGGAQIVNGRTYSIRFRARWLAGSTRLNTRLYFNRVPRTTILDAPTTSGTPGRGNSVYEPNPGPTFDGFRHQPLVPSSGEDVTVRVSADDPHGVTAALLWWSVNEGAWQNAPMARVAGEYSGTVPGQSAGRLVHFYVEAADGLGATATFPARGREARALYRVDDGQSRGNAPHNFRMLMTTSDSSFLHQELNVMSNERLGGTVVYREQEVFYDVGMRLKGSERGRLGGSRVSFSVRFHGDHLFRGAHRTVSLDRSGGWGIGAGPTGQDEIIFKQLVSASGGLPCMYDDICWLIAPRSSETGHSLLMMAKYGSDFLDDMYEQGSDGLLYKMELIYYPTSTTGGAEGFKRPQPDGVIGTDMRNLGDDPEAYRYNFMVENHRDRDEFDGLIRLCKTMGRSGAAFESEVDSVLDIDEALRMYAAHSLVGANDTYILGSNAHNLMLFERPSDRRFVLLFWDQDFAWSRSSSTALWGGENLAKLFGIPRYQRLFWGHLHDMMETTYNTDYMSYWTDHYGSMVGEQSSFGRVLTYIGQRRAYAQNRLPADVPFRITTNNGQDFAVDTPDTLIEGVGWIDVREIIVAGTETPGAEAPLATHWTALSGWEATVPLASGENDLSFLALNHQGQLVGTDSITVTTSFELPTPTITSVNPTSGPPGATVQVFGENFDSGTVAFFGAQAAETSVGPGLNWFEAYVPLLPPGDVTLTVKSGAGAISDGATFTVVDAPLFVRGDANLDAVVDISDAVRVLLGLFGGASLSCEDAADANDDENVDVSDVAFLLEYLFGAGAEPPRPLTGPGADTTGGGATGCEQGLPIFGG